MMSSNSKAAVTPSTLVDLLRLRTLTHVNRALCLFLVDGEAEEIQLTYEELDRQARAIAAQLQSLKASGERALLLYPPGLEFIAGFFGCLYAGVIAVPAYPPDPYRLTRTLPRLLAIVSDAQSKLVLTTSSILSMAQPLFEHVPELKNLIWLASDDIVKGLEDEWRKPVISSDTVALLQYTSGSTGTPRGVMLAHSNLLHNANLVHHGIEHSPDDKYVSWLPTFHDMGFMSGVLEPIYAGIPAVLMSPASFLEQPVRWLQAISSHKATTSGGPNFAYDLCARKITADQRAKLDLSTWSVAFNGAEPIRGETLERFVAAFESCGFRREAFYPCYGLAEATLIVSGGPKPAPPFVKKLQKKSLANNRVLEASEQDEDVQSVVGCGALLDQKIIIVDPESLCECLPNQVGEIWVAGPSVAKGYWNRLDETEQTFRARLSDTGEGPFLRTGDLGFLKDEELYVTGRIKDLIIIRGLNHYPQDIEWTVERAHPALRPGCGAAFSIHVVGEERLVLVQEVDERKQPEFDAVIDSIRRAVAENHELQAYAVVLVKAGSISKTSSGKIQRRVSEREFLEGTLDELARSVIEDSLSPSSEDSFIRRALLAVEPEKRQPLIESYLREQVTKALRVPISLLNEQRSLTALGLDSLMAVELRNRIELDLNLLIPMAKFLEGRSIAELAAYVQDQLQATSRAASPAVAPEGVAEYPLSYIQKSLWFIYQLAPESAAYNISFAARICSEVDGQALRRAFRGLVDRHPSLRTTYTSCEGQPIQRVHKHQDVRLEAINSSTWTQDDLNDRVVEEAHRPFDLERGPVLRVNLFTRSATEHVLLLTVHHVAIDGWSFWVLLDELRLLYPAAKAGAQDSLPLLSVQYADYVGWQAKMLAGLEGEGLWNYWQRELAGELPVLNLPTDRPRPPAQTYRGGTHHFMLNEELNRQLKSLAKSEHATLYMVVLAAFQVLLHRYTGQDDILVGSPTSARNRAGFAGVVGCFFNALVLRAKFSGDLTFREFLRQMRRTVLGALDHQDFPSHIIAERLQPVRDPSRPPLFQATFILQKPHRFEEALSILSSEDESPVDLGGLLLKPFPLEKRYARSDLELEMVESRRSLHGWLQYNSDLFNADTIARMAGHFQTLLESVITNPECRISMLRLLTEAERQQLLFEWSNTGKTYDCSLLVHQLFEEQVAKTPTKAAAVYKERIWTFQELNGQADRLADLLRRLKR